MTPDIARWHWHNKFMLFWFHKSIKLSKNKSLVKTFLIIVACGSKKSAMHYCDAVKESIQVLIIIWNKSLRYSSVYYKEKSLWNHYGTIESTMPAILPMLVILRPVHTWQLRQIICSSLYTCYLFVGHVQRISCLLYKKKYARLFIFREKSK